MLAFVIMRDRVTYARQCVAALEAAGLDVVIVDHGSDYPQARMWLEQVYEGVAEGQNPEADFPDIAWDHNRHPRDLWREYGPIHQQVTANERFIVTDCDVVPADDCPAGWVDLLGRLLDENPRAVKAGLALRTSDLPEHFANRAKVQEWEARFQRPRAPWAPGGPQTWMPPAVWADIDTTLAMYRRFEPFRLGPAIRTTAPYEALHLPWYEDSANPTEELAFYAANARYGHWRAPDGFTDTHALEG